MTSTTAPQEETWHGSCHCGANAFTVKLTEPLYEQDISNCNCSICALNGYLMIYPLSSDFVWSAGGPDSMTTYRFGKHRVGHLFCGVCGTSIGGKMDQLDQFGDKFAINVRTFKDVDVEKLKLKKFDGKNY